MIARQSGARPAACSACAFAVPESAGVSRRGLNLASLVGFGVPIVAVGLAALVADRAGTPAGALAAAVGVAVVALLLRPGVRTRIDGWLVPLPAENIVTRQEELEKWMKRLVSMVPVCIALFCAGAGAGAGEVRAAELPDFTKLVEQNAPAVVNISTVRRRATSRDDVEEFFRRFRSPDGRNDYVPPRSLGSGFIISRDGYILTNNHVVDQADEILVRLNDRRELLAEVVGADPRSDLALIKVDASDLPTVRIGDSEGLQVGAWVLAIGSPFGFDYSVTAGIVSAKGRSLPTDQGENYVPFIQTDVAINPGNSGGPLFDLSGQVVGINSQIYSNSGGFMGVSFAIPIDVAMEVADQLKTNGRVARGWLGVMIQDVTRDLAESFGLDRPHGALVSQVVENGPAETGGILPGDIIVAFEGKAIERSSELPHYVGRAPAGQKARLTVVRDGKRLDLDVEIGELPDADGPPVLARPGAPEPLAIGLGVEDLNAAQLERLGVAGGVRVVQSEGPAADAGILPGDVITRLNNAEVGNSEDFARIAGSLPPGSLVPVLVIRGETPTFLPLRVPE